MSIYFHLCLPNIQINMNSSTDQNEWLVIVNPNAGNGKGKKDWNRISGLIKKDGLPFTAKFTERKGHAIDITREAISAGFRNIITVGGDGTLNEVVNGVIYQHCLSSNRYYSLS